LRALARWLAAVAAGVLVFEGLDLLASPAVVAWAPVAKSVPALSPFLCGAAAAWTARLRPFPALLAAAAAAWARIGVDRAEGLLRGVHLSSESGLFLVLYFGVPWMLSAVVGGAAVVLVGRAARRRGSPRPAGQRYR